MRGGGGGAGWGCGGGSRERCSTEKCGVGSREWSPTETHGRRWGVQGDRQGTEGHAGDVTQTVAVRRTEVVSGQVNDVGASVKQIQ